MTKKKKRLLVVVVLAVVLVALLARPVVNLVIEWLDPGQAPLNDLFKLKKNEVALVINDEQSKEKGYEAEGEIYVPASVAYLYGPENLCRYSGKQPFLCDKWRRDFGAGRRSFLSGWQGDAEREEANSAEKR